MSTDDVLTSLQTEIYTHSQPANTPLDGVMHWLLDARNLEAAWERVRSAEGANTPGPDGVTAGDLDGRATRWCHAWAEDVRQECYKPSQPRWVDVPKNGDPSRMRRLGILTLSDRVLHAAIKQILEPIVDSRMSPHSFGFRPGRSVAGALEAVTKLLSRGGADALHFAVNLDVADCFETIDHALLLKRIASFIADQQFLRLLDEILRAGGKHERRLWHTHRHGIVQGSALSPLLCNLYLDQLDQQLSVLNRETQGGVHTFRYADDLLLLARDRSYARRGVTFVRKCLRGLQQALRSTKTSLAPVQTGFDWLGVHVHPRCHAWSKQAAFGYLIPDHRIEAMFDRILEMTAPPSSRIDADAFDLARWLVSINDQLHDWRQAYIYADNAYDVFRELDEHTRHRFAELVHAVTGLRRSQILRRHFVRLPRGFWTWQIDGVRLATLAALAPHNPVHLTRKPRWLRSIAAPSDSGPHPKNIAAPGTGVQDDAAENEVAIK